MHACVATDAWHQEFFSLCFFFAGDKTACFSAQKLASAEGTHFFSYFSADSICEKQTPGTQFTAVPPLPASALSPLCPQRTLRQYLIYYRAPKLQLRLLVLLLSVCLSLLALMVQKCTY
jgi:hypothetical protein